MVALNSPVCEFGLKAPEFSLPNINNDVVTLASSMGERGLLVMFICNHCPFVKSILPELVQDCRELAQQGINTVAIMSNDVENYPDDHPDLMKELATLQEFPFPYLYDETQAIAKAYGAVCTPDFFGYNKDFELQYRGRFDATGRERTNQPSSRDLFHAMLQIAETGHGPQEQVASIGCSIKWK